MLAATACGTADAPSGQVVAVVNGEEITTAELNEEARVRNLPIARDRAARDALVQELVDRKLLVDAAMERGLHETPQHLLTVRRLREIALAQQLLSDQNGSRQWSQQQLEQFITANPHAFQERALLGVDRIAVQQPLTPALRIALAAAPGAEEMTAIARRAGLSVERQRETWDSATLTDPLKSRYDQLQPGRTFFTPTAGGAVAGVVVSRTPQPVPSEQRLDLARSLLEQQASNARLEQLLQQVRSSAEVKYQQGFDPDSGQAQ